MTNLLRPRRQCAKCPWKKTTDPRTIPGGYDEAKHAALVDTIARPHMPVFSGPLKMMACHETPVGAELPCVGWLAHQLGDGNNLHLRLLVAMGNVDANVETVGSQHGSLEETLPR